MFLSVVIPVYNVKAYIGDCLDSLLMQDISCSEYEIICINDGSVDGSLEILRKYEAENDNITVINQPNGGVCKARNAGIDAAKGDYIWLVDGDDLVQRNSLASIRTLAESTKADRVTFDTYIFNQELTDEEQRLMESGKLRRNCNLTDSNVFTSIIRRDYLLKHDHRFHYPELKYGEDCVFVYEVQSTYPVTVKLEQVLYLYRKRPGSAMDALNKNVSAAVMDSHLRITEILREHWVNEHGEPEKTANFLMTYLWYTLYLSIGASGSIRRAAMVRLKRAKLFPFKRPKECTVVRSYHTMRTDLVGKSFDWIYLHMHTRLGYFLMRLWKCAEAGKRWVRRQG